MFRNLMLVAVAAMAFVSCQNEGVEEVVRPQEVAMTIIADVDDTRTVIDEENNRVNWSEGDALKVIENSATYRTTTAINIDSNGKAQFTVSFPANTEATSFTYNAIYPATAVVEDEAEKINNEKVKVIVKDQQKPTATSFDPEADILVSKHIETETQPTVLNMQFKRLVALGKMILKNLPAEVNSISQVIFIADGENSKAIAGRNYVNATTGEVTEYGYFGDTNTITMNYNEPIKTRDIYFTCNPFELVAGETFTIKAICNNATYTREVAIPEGRSLTFAEGELNTFSVDMTNATKESNFTFADGNYAVIAKDNTKYYAMGGKGSGSYMSNVEVEYDGAATTFTTDNEALIWTITAVDGGFTFQNNEGKYLYWSSGNNSYLGDESKAQAMTITPIDGTSQYKVAVKDTPERILSYNASSPRFAFYGNTGQKYQLYLVPVGENTEPYFTVTPTEYTFEADGDEYFFNIEPHNGYNGNVTATSTADWLLIDQDGYKVCVEANSNNGAARETTITFTDGNKSLTATVKQKGNAITSISEALESADATAVKFENVTVAATYAKGVLVTDGSAYILVYKGSEISDAVIGSVVTVEGTMGTYGGLRQVASPTVEIKGSTNYQHPTAEVFDADDFAAFISSPSVKYVEYTGTLNISGNYYNVKIEGTENQEGSISYPKSDAINADDNGKKITVRGYTIGVSSNNKYVNTMLVEYSVVNDDNNDEEDDDNNDGETTTTYTFSKYTAGTQYAKNEAHELDDVLTITTTECHFTSELRIYSSSTHDGYAIGTLAEGHTIKSLGFNAGNKTDTLNVYGSTDGNTWTLVKGVKITSTTYNDYSVDFENTNYTYFKLDVAGSNQVRLKTLTLTYIN